MNCRHTHTLGMLARAPVRALRPLQRASLSTHGFPVVKPPSKPPPQLVKVVPEGDTKVRRQCPQCERIMYSNPTPVGVVVIADSCPSTGRTRVLLVRRAIQPRKGYWTVPGGFLENGESTVEGAIREAQEEAGADIVVKSLLGVYSLPMADQLMIWFRAEFTEGAPLEGEDRRFEARHESLEAKLFAYDEIPWKELAFPSTRMALEDFFSAPHGPTAFYRTVTEMPPADRAE
jgi:ADP-ribose pyrophosphatase YjhB (NUDIX family)